MPHDAEIIEGEVTERALTTVPPTAGTRALALLSDREFEQNLKAIAKGQERIKQMQEALLVRGVDYANVPKVDKPSLGKPGAEKLCLAYGLAANIETRLTPGDGKTAPLLTYDSTCFLHLGSLDGPIVGVGHGTCNSWEVKYRYRDASYLCPDCGKELRHSKPPKTGWYCWAKLGGCGKEFPERDPRIASQVIGRIENPDPHDLANTLMKMSEKRAHVDATLRTTAASGIFTQDVEDNVGTMPATPEPEPAAADTHQNAPQRSQGPSAAGRSGSTGAVAGSGPNMPPALEEAELDSLFDQVPGAPALTAAAFIDWMDSKALDYKTQCAPIIKRLFPKSSRLSDLTSAQLEEARQVIAADLLNGAA